MAADIGIPLLIVNFADRSVTGCWVLGAGCWLLVTGYWLLVTGYWLLGAGCWVLGAGCWLHVPIKFLLFTLNFYL